MASRSKAGLLADCLLHWTLGSDGPATASPEVKAAAFRVAEWLNVQTRPEQPAASGASRAWHRKAGRRG